MLQDRGALVAMDDAYLLSDEDLPDKRQRVEEGKESHITGHDWEVGQVVDFHTVGHVPDATAFALEVVSDEGDSVASFHEALSKLIAVSLHATELREGEISADEHIVLLTRSGFPDHRLHEKRRTNHFLRKREGLLTEEHVGPWLIKLSSEAEGVSQVTFELGAGHRRDLMQSLLDSSRFLGRK